MVHSFAMEGAVTVGVTQEALKLAALEFGERRRTEPLRAFELAQARERTAAEEPFVYGQKQIFDQGGFHRGFYRPVTGPSETRCEGPAASTAVGIADTSLGTSSASRYRCRTARACVASEK